MAATILLVDSDSPNSADWKAFLQNHGFKVFEAMDGRTAIEQCPRVQPDLVLLQAALPDMHGTEVCRLLKSDPLNRLTPVVLIMDSQNSYESSCEREVSADDFWDRPLSRWEALSRVQAILQLKSCIDQQGESVLFSLARSIEARDPLTDGHSERLAAYSAELAENLGLPIESIELLRVASLVHDIGKVAVPDSVLFKPGKLTPGETRVMRQHPVVGEQICSPLRSFRDVLPIIRHHHERMDGSGYPDHLVGEDIPLTARILQVVDVYDALTTDRPYRKALSRECALAVMANEANCGLLDPSLVSHFSHFCRTARLSPPMQRSAPADYVVH